MKITYRILGLGAICAAAATAAIILFPSDSETTEVLSDGDGLGAMRESPAEVEVTEASAHGVVNAESAETVADALAETKWVELAPRETALRVYEMSRRDFSSAANFLLAPPEGLAVDALQLQAVLLEEAHVKQGPGAAVDWLGRFVSAAENPDDVAAFQIHQLLRHPALEGRGALTERLLNSPNADVQKQARYYAINRSLEQDGVVSSFQRAQVLGVSHAVDPDGFEEVVGSAIRNDLAGTVAWLRGQANSEVRDIYLPFAESQLNFLSENP